MPELRPLPPTGNPLPPTGNDNVDESQDFDALVDVVEGFSRQFVKFIIQAHQNEKPSEQTERTHTQTNNTQNPSNAGKSTSSTTTSSSTTRPPGNFSQKSGNRRDPMLFCQKFVVLIVVVGVVSPHPKCGVRLIIFPCRPAEPTEPPAQPIEIPLKRVPWCSQGVCALVVLKVTTTTTTTTTKRLATDVNNNNNNDDNLGKWGYTHIPPLTATTPTLSTPSAHIIIQNLEIYLESSSLSSSSLSWCVCESCRRCRFVVVVCMSSSSLSCV